MKGYISVLLFLSISLIPLITWSQCRLDKSQYELVLDEEFSNYSGSVEELLGPKSIWKAIPDEGEAHGWGTEYYDPQQIQLLKDEVGREFLRLTAQSLREAKTFSNGRQANYKSGMLMLKSRAQLNKLNINFDQSIEGCYRDSRGYRYGMFEIRCKLPKTSRSVKDSWPAFWLISVDSEIDIIDNMHADNAGTYDSYINDWVKLPWSPYNTQWKEETYCKTCPEFQLDKFYEPGDVISVNWGKSYENVSKSTPLACHQVYQSRFHDFTDYTTYTCVWTPDKVTFFIEGVEVYTVPDSLAHVMTYCPMTILLTLQTMGQVSSEEAPKEFHFDIDYIKVYKAKDGVDMNDFKSSHAYNVHDLTRDVSRSNRQAVHRSVQNITTLQNDIVYKNASQQIVLLTKVNGAWGNSFVKNGRRKIVLSSGLVTHPNGETVHFWDKNGEFNSGKFHNGKWNGKSIVVKNAQSRKLMPLKKHEVFQINEAGQVFFVAEDSYLYSFYIHSEDVKAQRILKLDSPGQYNFSIHNNELVVAINDSLLNFYRLKDSGQWIFQKSIELNNVKMSQDPLSLQYVEFVGAYVFKTTEGEIKWVSFEQGVFQMKDINTHVGENTITVDVQGQSLLYIDEEGDLLHMRYETSDQSWSKERVYASTVNRQFTGYRNTKVKYSPNFIHQSLSQEHIKYVYANHDGRLTAVEFGPCENVIQSCHDQPQNHNIHTLNTQP